MVASSRSSARRHTLRGDHGHAHDDDPDDSSRSSSPVIHSRPPAPPTRTPHPLLRVKRRRASSRVEPEQLQLHKRRKLNSKFDTPQIQIPVRSRIAASGLTSSNIVTQSIPAPKLAVSHYDGRPVPESPSSKPQYDQIRLIEENARAAIRRGISENLALDERRKLRSEHGGSRSKTELAQYFPNFEEMLSLEPANPDILTARTKLVLVDDTPDFQPSSRKTDPFGTNKALHKTTILDLSRYLNRARLPREDPLNAEVFAKAHRKAERHEKQMKNGDRERAQHEKYQLEHLLDELRGPDWLKTLGISGITETEKKRYEPKRALFIRETRALIEKFRWWKEEEKRRKTEREQALLEEAAEMEEDEEEEEQEEEEEEEDDEEADESPQTTKIKREPVARSRNRHRSPSSPAASTDKGLDSSEMDALASQQLLEEAKSANTRNPRPRPKLDQSQASPAQPLEPDPPFHPFLSFFAKRHLRDAALSGRQRGRTVLAFGLLVPDLPRAGTEDGVDAGEPYRDFDLPEKILTDDAIRRGERRRRRVRRGSEPALP